MAALFWFTNDLRLADNPGLAAAARDYGEVVPLYVLDENDPWAPGGASRWWLHHSLGHLQTRIAEQRGSLLLRRGESLATIMELVETLGIEAVYFSRAYEPWQVQVQQRLFDQLNSKGIPCKRYGSRLLVEPDHVLNQQGKPFQVFTPFYKAVLKSPFFGPPSADKPITWAKLDAEPAHSLAHWQLIPQRPNWAKPFESLWQPGEQAAQQSLAECLDGGIEHYSDDRDYPARQGTSRLSPALHSGELSPRQIWYAVENRASLDHETRQPFLRQLIWREFSHYLLHHWPHIDSAPFKEKLAHFPWQNNPTALSAWQQGQTGYPIVDAGMRELWHTGWMHNRVRMIAASFLTKHLQVHWREGAKWFWDTLVDADLANNSAGWQWVAGCGADAAPYFRIFNPRLQGEKFDKKGAYIRRWLPELAPLPDKHIHTPWLAPQAVQAQAGVLIGRDYPAPIVDHQQAREAALFSYRSLA